MSDENREKDVRRGTQSAWLRGDIGKTIIAVGIVAGIAVMVAGSAGGGTAIIIGSIAAGVYVIYFS
jgi:hypothetical protein